MSWVDELHEKYYHLFETYDEETKPNGYYKEGDILRGIEVAPGWEEITRKLLEGFEWIRTHNNYFRNPCIGGKYDGKDCIPGPLPVIKIFQIKQKFGNFRCYYTVFPHTNRNVIIEQCEYHLGAAAAMASVTCEVCGAIGKWEKTRGGWIATYCTDCLTKKSK